MSSSWTDVNRSGFLIVEAGWCDERENSWCDFCANLTSFTRKFFKPWSSENLTGEFCADEEPGGSEKGVTLLLLLFGLMSTGDVLQCDSRSLEGEAESLLEDKYLMGECWVGPDGAGCRATGPVESRLMGIATPFR